jgi:hypothetical protein
LHSNLKVRKDKRNQKQLIEEKKGEKKKLHIYAQKQQNLNF